MTGKDPVYRYQINGKVIITPISSPKLPNNFPINDPNIQKQTTTLCDVFGGDVDKIKEAISAISHNGFFESGYKITFTETEGISEEEAKSKATNK